jgi:hypothetical protein
MNYIIIQHGKAKTFQSGRMYKRSIDASFETTTTPTTTLCSLRSQGRVRIFQDSMSNGTKYVYRETTAGAENSLGAIYSMAHGLDPHTVDAIIAYLRADKSHCASQFLPRADAQKPRLPTLPPEVIDMVIDFLHSNKRSLAACSLTCKMWLSSGRFHLFSKVLLSTEKRISSFAALFEKPFNSVAPFVQHLIISLCPRGYHTCWARGKRVEIITVCDFACHCYSTTLYYY